MTNPPSVTPPRLGKDLRFRKTNRVLKPADFRRVYDTGARFSCPFFVAFLLRRAPESSAGAAGPRIGFTIPKAVGKAVLRNRIRRRIREMLRQRLDRIDAGLDIVINPRRVAAEAPGEELTRQVERLVARCHV